MLHLQATCDSEGHRYVTMHNTLLTVVFLLISAWESKNTILKIQ